MMHYRIDSKLNKEKSHTVKQNDPYRMIALALIIKLAINTIILIAENTSEPILHIFAHVQHRIHIVIIFSVKWAVSHVGVLSHFDEGEEADGSYTLEGTYLKVKILLIKRLTSY
jgi:hypothetical protein